MPLLKPEAPLVGTGIESDVALDSGVTIVAKKMEWLIKSMEKELFYSIMKKITLVWCIFIIYKNLKDLIKMRVLTKPLVRVEIK